MIGELGAGTFVRTTAAVHDGGPFDRIVVVPACDEAERIGRLIASLRDQRRVDLARTLAVVVANNSTDATAAHAASALHRTRLPFVVIDAMIAHGGVGAARAAGFQAAAPLASASAHYLTTDADCTLAPDWLAANAKHLASVDAVCGLTLADPTEAERDPTLLVQQSLERAYLKKSLRLARQIDPHYAPRREHHQMGGASLGLGRAAYEAVGGFASMSSGEDRGLIEALVHQGFSVAHVDDVKVFASVRTEGRAPGGMASVLRERLTRFDPFVDSNLERVEALLRRVRIHLGLRRMFELGSLMQGARHLLVTPDDVAAVARCGTFQSAWLLLEQRSPQLHRVQMTLHELVGQSSVLNDLLSGVEGPAGALCWLPAATEPAVAPLPTAARSMIELGDPPAHSGRQLAWSRISAVGSASSEIASAPLDEGFARDR